MRRSEEPPLPRVQSCQDRHGGKEMNYSDTMDKAREYLDDNDLAKAQALATMAIADRLDRLCEILSARNGNRQKW